MHASRSLLLSREIIDYFVHTPSVTTFASSVFPPTAGGDYSDDICRLFIKRCNQDCNVSWRLFIKRCNQDNIVSCRSFIKRCNQDYNVSCRTFIKRCNKPQLLLATCRSLQNLCVQYSAIAFWTNRRRSHHGKNPRKATCFQIAFLGMETLICRSYEGGLTDTSHGAALMITIQTTVYPARNVVYTHNLSLRPVINLACDLSLIYIFLVSLLGEQPVCLAAMECV